MLLNDLIFKFPNGCGRICNIFIFSPSLNKIIFKNYLNLNYMTAITEQDHAL